MKLSVINRPSFYFGLLLVVQLILHSSVFQKDLLGFHVWRQTQTQNTILSFVEEDFNILNPRKNDRGAGDGIFRMEFPLSQWLIAIPVKFIGHPVFVSRLMNFLFAFLSIIGLYKWTKLYFTSKWILVAGIMLLSFSPVFYYYMVNPMPDNLALCFGIWGLFGFAKWQRTADYRYMIYGMLLFALASLVKLPFILYYSLFGWAIIFPSKSSGFKEKIKTLFYGVLCASPVLAWYIWVIPGWEGNGIVQGIFQMDPEQKSLYWHYVWFHIRTTLPELLLGWPAVPFFALGIYQLAKKKHSYFRTYGYYVVLGVLLIAYLMFEMNMIEKVHDYYFLPLLPLLVIVALLGIRQIQSCKFNDHLKKSILVLLIISLSVFSYFRIQSRWDRLGFNPDLLTFKNELRMAVPENALVCVGNDTSHHIFLYYVQKMGWAFENNWINAQIIREMIEKGCRYLYCDSRAIDQKPDIQALFGTKVAEYGSIKVFELKEPEDLLD